MDSATSALTTNIVFT